MNNALPTGTLCSVLVSAFRGDNTTTEGIQIKIIKINRGMRNFLCEKIKGLGPFNLKTK